jgi:ABC-2 type transport system ATP-binding protein
VPNDIDPEEPDRHSSARVVRIADTVSPAPDKPRRPPRKARADGGTKSAPRTTRPAGAPKPTTTPAEPESAPEAEVEPSPSAHEAEDGVRSQAGSRRDPGPPPPLPSDLEIAASAAAALVVPPRPPLPAPELAPVDSPGAEAEAEAKPAGPSAVIAPLADSAAVVDAEPVVESAPVAEPAAATDAAPSVDAEPAVIEAAPAVAETVPSVDVAPVVEAAPPPAAEPAVVLEAAPAFTVPVLDASAVEASAPAPLLATAGDALVLRGVTKRFGSTHAVDGIDLTIPAGTFYGLVGPNGAGKTTTLSMIAGLLVPDRGTIHVGGVDAAAKPLAAKKLMGVLPDRLRTFDRLTGRQLLHYYGVLRKLPPAVVESRTRDLARAFDLEDALGRSVSDYSAGMLKKVMLAGALIHSPRLLVLDEPFEAVDPVSSSIILDILSTYVAHGGTVILSSHGMDLVERVCTRVAVIVAGQVLAEGTVDEVRGELTLEQRFVELAGGLSDVEGLEWLHTFSD